MYHFFVGRRLRSIIGSLNRGDHQRIVSQFSPRAEHWFSGDHALAGGRHSPELIQAWYRRLTAVFPGITFDAKKFVIDGPPWRTYAAIEWVDRVIDRKGNPLPNHGVFLITLKWGRATELHVYTDTQKLASNLSILSAQGVNEAAAPPIQDRAN